MPYSFPLVNWFLVRSAFIGSAEGLLSLSSAPAKNLDTSLCLLYNLPRFPLTGGIPIAYAKKLSVQEMKQRNLNTYGTRIRFFRTQAGLSMDQLASQLDVSSSTVRNWECGLTRPDPEYLYPLFRILNVQPNVFFGTGDPDEALSEQEKALVGTYRMLDARGQEDLLVLARALCTNRHI